MRRIYAFEAEGVSEEVKSQLKLAEDAVEDKCETPEDCDELLEKIESQADKFDDALKAMSGAAKDCKDGKCDSDEMAEKITPAMADLKEVAKTVGVAKEGDTVTEDELKDVKDYLEGAKEIVEAKKDELEDGDGGSKGGKDDKDDDDDDEPTVDDAVASEAYGLLADEVDYALDSYMDALDDMSAGIMTMVAMEGANMDAIGAVRQYLRDSKSAKSEMKAAVSAKDYQTASEKAREVADHVGQLQSSLSSIPPSVGSTVITTIALGLIALAASGVVGKLVGKAATALKGTKVYQNAKQRYNDSKFVTKRNDKLVEKELKKDAKASAKAKKSALSHFEREQKSADNYAKGGVGAKLKDAKSFVGSKLYHAGTAIGEKTAPVTGAVHKGAVAVGAFATKHKGQAAIAGKALATGAAVGIPGVSTLLSTLKKKKAVDEEGNPISVELNANDFNVLIGSMKTAAAGIKKHYEKLASDYASMASSGAAEDDSAESAAEAFNTFYGDDAMAAFESAGSDTTSFDSFVDACESLMIGGHRNSFLYS